MESALSCLTTTGLLGNLNRSVSDEEVTFNWVGSSSSLVPLLTSCAFRGLEEVVWIGGRTSMLVM